MRPFAQRLVVACVFNLIALLAAPTTSAQSESIQIEPDQREPNWSADAPIPPEGRFNPYQLDAATFEDAFHAGRLHALNYPVEISGILLPYESVRRFLAADSANPLKELLQRMVGGLNRMRSFEALERWLGLHNYPQTEGEIGSVYHVPFKNGTRPERAMGMTLIETPKGTAFTISCAQCHSANLFGRKVIGLTNRFPRANRFFARGLAVEPAVSSSMFRWSTDATAEEAELFARTKHSLQFVGAKRPVQLGLDTSLAQVALSLAKREQDDVASRHKPQVKRTEPLARFVADSKPAVWWNLKYKTRWLSDGSVLSGNPILTNLLWNEIGRGTDLQELEQWVNTNPMVIRDLTTAVFASEAPRFTDFFPAETFPIEDAKRGEKVYTQSCARCHGVYQKAWSLPNANSLTPVEQLATVNIKYRSPTPVIDIGTDPQRWQGMASLEQLNDLKISRHNDIVIQRQKGYVPPPLVGIWARWPYLHNNSIPSLCALLTPQAARPATYWAREAKDPVVDFDAECNGYPLGERPPHVPKEYYYDTRREGLSNRGHDEGIFIKNGAEVLSTQDKRDLIRFLQTL